WTLVVRHPAAAVLHEIPLGRGGARPEHDQRLDRLAPLLVGDADHRDLRDRGMLEQAVLDLDRRHVLAARDDDVLLAIADADVGAVLVATVAGVKPAVDDRLGRFLRLVPVALEDVVRARQHLALAVHAHADADRGHAGTRQPSRTLAALQPIPFRGRTVDGQ